MGKKKLLIVTQLYPYPGNIFLGTFVTQQLQYLKEFYDITVLTVIPSSLKEPRNKPPFDSFESGVRIIRIPYYPMWLNIFSLFRFTIAIHVFLNKCITHYRLLRVAKRLHAQEHFDLVHGHETYIGDEAGPIGKALGIPSFFTLHSFYHYHTKIFGQYAVRLSLKNLRMCKRYASVSTIAADSYVKEGLPRNKFTIIPNGVNESRPVDPNQQIVDFARGRKVLLSVGYLTDDKRFDLSIRTLSKLPSDEVVLVIVGLGSAKSKLMQLATTLRCADRILWLGAVPPDAMPAVYQASHIVVHPSVIDSFSMVCLEAMSHGKVVICNTLIGISEFTHDGVNILLVPPDSVEATTDAVQRVLRDPAEYRRISKNAYDFGKTMTWEHQVRTIVQWYNLEL